MDKTAIRNFAIEARKILMKSAIQEAGFYGITKEACKSPIQKAKDFEVYETLAGTENRIYGDDIKRRANLVDAINEQGFEQVIEETAYTWFNRIIAIRFMEVNNYLPTRVRVLSSESGSGTPDVVTQVDTVELNLTSEELDRIQQAKNDNKYDEAFRLLFIKQCNELNEILPGLFEKTNDYMELLLKLPYTSDGVVRMLVDSIPEDNFNVETEGQVEIIGWMYQYYNTELKDDTFAKLKKNVKISKERIPAATQLFTPDWIVRYMVENSLGRVWIEHLRAVDSSVDEKEKAEEFGWRYYLPETEQEDDVAAQLVEIRSSYKNLTPQEITCIDPCMGSGHILVYMFDVLMDIYKSEGFSEREAVFDILEKNIRGLDIDRRAYQLSYFALMMKARGYNRIFFRGHENLEGERVQAVPQVYAIEESNSVNRNQLKYFGASMSEIEKNDAMNQILGLLDQMRDAKEYGSILIIDNYNWELLKRFISDYGFRGQMDLEMVGIDNTANTILKIINVGNLLATTYITVITNPPYMGSRGMGQLLNTYVQKNYPNSKSDMFAVFIERCRMYAKKKAAYGMITQPSFLFLTAFEELRKGIIESQTISSLLHLGRGIFGVDFGSTAFVLRNCRSTGYSGTYMKLHQRTFQYIDPDDIRDLFLKTKENHEYKFDFMSYHTKSDVEIADEDEEEIVFENSSQRMYYTIKQYEFLKIPGTPVAYWLSNAFIQAFQSEKLGDNAEIITGMTTGKNSEFLRLWYEVDWRKTAIGCSDMSQIDISKTKWIPYSKGGNRRNWTGNADYLVNWSRKGEFNRSKTTLQHLYLRKGLTWPFISSGKFSARYLPEGFLWDVAGSPCFFDDERKMYYALGLLCTKVADQALKIMNPTINVQAIDIAKLPFIYNSEKVDEVVSIVKECIRLSEDDWNERETSWNFKKNPLIGRGNNLQDVYKEYEQEVNARFKKIKENEERLNDIFSEIYGLSEEFDSQIADKDVTVRKANLTESIQWLMSYAVGCMFGRYSLDKEGLIFAGGEINYSEYKTFVVNKDGVIPVTEENYFEDDIVEMFCSWLRKAFGEEYFEANLKFIAMGLGNKNGTAKDVIRSYFLNDFYENHCDMYSVSGSGHRPIYWMFESGKQKGFKCLVYMHRYNRELVGLIRSDYLSRTQSAIENSLNNVDYIIKTSNSAVDRAQATKKRDKHIKQLAEIKAYYPALSHIALNRIELDLDDGVKANYEKFQGIEVINEGEKKQKINLLAKI